jgi:hypothetical protein
LFESLARFALAARKFPESAQVRIRMALRDQEFAVAEDQAGGNVNRLE